jgi:hypothetical protein
MGKIAHQFGYIWTAPSEFLKSGQLPEPLPVAPIDVLTLDCLFYLSFFLDARDLSTLKLSGCHHLWSKIQNLTTNVCFNPVEGRFLSPVMLPDPFLLLSGFKHLETVCLHRVYHNYRPFQSSPLITLPPTLKHLTLDLRRFGTDFQLNHLSFVNINWSDTFPRLEILRLCFLRRTMVNNDSGREDDSWTKTLPRGLRVLSLMNCIFDLLTFLSDLCMTFNTDWLPPGKVFPHEVDLPKTTHYPVLEILELAPFSQLENVEFSTLPSSLTSLRLQTLVKLLPLYTPSMNDVSGMIGLQHLAISDESSFQVAPTDWLSNIPCNTLRAFESNVITGHSVTPDFISSHCALLKTFKCVLVDLPLLQALPDHLTSLTIRDFDETMLAIALPRFFNLTQLIIRDEVIQTGQFHESLPDSLTWLDIVSDVDPTSTHHYFPPNLSRLRLQYSGLNDSHLILLPRSITYLHLASLDEVDQFLLPPNLTFLRIEDNLDASMLPLLPRSLRFCALECVYLPDRPKDQQGAIAAIGRWFRAESNGLVEAIEAAMNSVPPGCLFSTRFQREEEKQASEIVMPLTNYGFRSARFRESSFL